jgi:hypothetical protein
LDDKLQAQYLPHHDAQTATRAVKAMAKFVAGWGGNSMNLPPNKKSEAGRSHYSKKRSYQWQ